MGKTSTYTLTTTPKAVTATFDCTEITVGEDDSVAGWPTVNFQVRKPDSADQPIEKTAGKTYTFTRGPGKLFSRGDVAGYISTKSGSSTFFQDEHL